MGCSACAPSKKNDPAMYSRKLLDTRWKAKRLALFAARGTACEACGVNGAATTVHHMKYEDELEPWEYSDSDYLLVCRDCHKRIHGK